MDGLPDPMTPPDCDLRDFPAMLLDVVRLRDSELSAGESAEAFRAAVLSWCVSWHQLPAASLPNDDAKLAYLLGYGRDLTTWRAVRAAGGMRGWVLCSDGRLYHPVVAEKALAAIDMRAKQHSRTEAARQAKAEKAAREAAERDRSQAVAGHSEQAPSETEKQSATDDETDAPSVPVAGSVTEHVTSSKLSEVKGSKGKKEESSASPPTGARRAAKRVETMPDIPVWMPQTEWRGYLDMRRSVRKPPTPHAVELIVRQLDEMRSRDIDVASVLNQSTRNNWTGLFEPKVSGRPGGGGRPDPAMSDDWKRIDESLGIQPAGAFR